MRIINKKYLYIIFALLLPYWLYAGNKDTCFQALKKDRQKLQSIARQLDNYDRDNYYYTLPLHNRNYNFDSLQDWEHTLKNINYHCDNQLRKMQYNINAYPCIPNIYYLKALALFYVKDYPQAQETYATLLEKYVQDTTFYIEIMCRYINCTYLMGEYEQASFMLDTLTLQYDSSLLMNNLTYLYTATDLYLEWEQWDKAIPVLQQLLNNKIPYALKTRVWFILGQIYESQKQYDNAIEHFRTVTNRNVASLNMRSYAILHQHFCQLDKEKHYQDSIEQEIYKLNNPTPTTFEPSVVESSSEHNNFENQYPYYFNDLASMFFFEDTEEDPDDSTYWDDFEDEEMSAALLDSIFENWDSISIHIPRTDFSTMKDTLYLPLVGPGYKLPKFNSLVSKFGWRKRRYHYGVDTKNQMYDSIYCVFDGVVRIAKRNRTYGNVVIVRHYNGMETFYAHCSKLLVNPNEEVKAGDVIALVGSTGRSTGPHLHFETRYKGTPINPEFIIDFENNKLRSDTLLICKETFSLKKSSGSARTSSAGNTGTSYSGNAAYYTVRYGDTLSSIAQKYHTSVSNIKRMNGLRSDFIREGQKLRVR
ncbi:MAG: peptidoglycan DD-metalloendopeptidase family protein [Bacteroidales bacterium]|nr:peptidoglycan DD-metalloendopeptidase family protein [Bacteroidales bacterium]